ncbi:MAG: hypothetical protein M3552_18230 [Planctomycetota bacterium]|nr:hypothetical protein [Planctomycetaceae bacterium]MDQ3332557.1 hypothetical protein [Planctomycetota bacterium]
MRLLFGALLTLSITGCMCRPGVIDCTTGRAYPGFCKPLCGGPCDPFMWIAGDCSTCCCCSYKCGYTPYGGRTHCGDDMVYGPSCVAPPLRWAAPAVPMPPWGHTVHLPGPLCPPVTPAPLISPPDAVPPVPPPTAPPADAFSGSELQTEAGPRILHDARNDRPERSRL